MSAMMARSTTDIYPPNTSVELPLC